MFYLQVLVLRKPFPFFQEASKQLKIYNGVYGFFFSKANLRDGLRKFKKIVTYICDVGASLIGRSQFGQYLFPNFSGRKIWKFYDGTNGQFLLCFLILRNLTMEIGEIDGICVAQVVFTNARLGFWGPSPDCYRGRQKVKSEILSKIFDKFFKWRLIIPQLGGIWEIENSRAHHSIWLYSLQIWWDRLNSHGETLAQIGWGRSSLFRLVMLLAASGLNVDYCSRKENRKS